MQERLKSKSKSQADAASDAKTELTLEIDGDAASKAAAKGLDLAQLLERAIEAETSTRQDAQLSEDEQKGLEALERYVAEHGAWWEEEEPC